MNFFKSQLYRFCAFLQRYIHVPAQVSRFFIIGCINTAFVYGLYSSFIFCNLHYTLAVLFSTLIGICFSFKTFGTMVFANDDKACFGRFVAVYAVCYFINVGLLRFLSIYLLPNLYIAGLVSSLFVACISFVVNREWVFKK